MAPSRAASRARVRATRRRCARRAGRRASASRPHGRPRACAVARRAAPGSRAGAAGSVSRARPPLARRCHSTTSVRTLAMRRGPAARARVARPRRRARARRPCSAARRRSARRRGRCGRARPAPGRPAGASNATSAVGRPPAAGGRRGRGRRRGSRRRRPEPVSGTAAGSPSPPISSSVAANAPAAGGVKRTATSHGTPAASWLQRAAVALDAEGADVAAARDRHERAERDRPRAREAERAHGAVADGHRAEGERRRVERDLLHAADAAQRQVEIREAGDRDVERRGVGAAVAGVEADADVAALAGREQLAGAAVAAHAEGRVAVDARGADLHVVGARVLDPDRRGLLARVDGHDAEVLRARLRRQRRGVGRGGGGGGGGEGEQRECRQRAGTSVRRSEQGHGRVSDPFVAVCPCPARLGASGTICHRRAARPA